MPILVNDNMGSSFDEFKKRASSFLKEKIVKTVRLKLTDVTPAEILTEEATNGNPRPPDARGMAIISQAAFEVDDYWRIVEILHKRLVQFDRKNWRVTYKALIVLEHLLTHGPQRVVEEFQSDRGVIKEMKDFQYVDQKGFNWGARVGDLSERVQNLLEDGEYLREERARARKLTRGIQGFGSLQRPFSSTDVGGFEGCSSSSPYGRCNSQYSEITGFDSRKYALMESNMVMDGNEECRHSTEDHPFCEIGRPTNKMSLLPSPSA
ncbi:epsin-2 [Eucalyptus grandis]|uniref:epsin-2 n=1 Tax=Eucalyptus grandis TaxID=71139 RepID=UPI000526C029|nr:epsin-2 [Eucalyptus grandis]